MLNAEFNKETFKNSVKENVKMLYRKNLEEASQQEIYQAVCYAVKDVIIDNWLKTQKAMDEQDPKILYYMSMEFLMGRALGNNLINLTAYKQVQEALDEMGLNLNLLEDQERDPALGNGGLGRLAACFLDSIATLGLPGDGIGLNYHFGLFRQLLVDHKQKEVKNPWITNESWLVRQPVSFAVPYKNFTMHSTLYDIDVPGYNNGCNRLHLFDVDTVDESIVPSDSINFDKHQIQKNLTLFLYPDDSDRAGQLLRIYQQYFMVSCGAQLILSEAKDRGCNLHDLADYAAIQINDTHPSMVIPELIRLLTKEGIPFDEAAEIVTNTCAYTNHTILAEALEKWPMSFIEEVAPAIVPIIQKLNEKINAQYHDEKVAIIDGENRVHMAHMDIHFSHSVNGVAYLHTEILKNTELHNFYTLYPEKFNNKTNGITFRRWLLHANPLLSSFLSETIGDGYKKDAEKLNALLDYRDDKAVCRRLLEIKDANKKALASYLKQTQGIKLLDNAIYDIQIKRLHEYKRQQLNALYAIHKYLEIKSGKIPKRPIVLLFGAKAAPAYVIAKDIIHLILCLQRLIEKDRKVRKHLQVVMVENYNVTKAEKLIPACDISEQISLASKEASGTGNMKFMLNGAVTLGTEDGANVEIHELVGDDNIYVFGEDSDTVIARYERGDYCSKDYYEKDSELKEAVDFIVSKKMQKLGDKTMLTRLYNELLNKDWFMTFPDYRAYVAAKEKAYADYENREEWAKKMLVNISKAGFFSSDRTISQYNDEIWHLSEGTK